VQFTFDVHHHSFVSVRRSLQSSAYIANLHGIFVNPRLLSEQWITQRFKLSLLYFEFVNLLHDSLRLIDLSLFTQLLSFLNEEIDLLFQLIYPLMSLLLLKSIHLGRIHA